MKALQTATNYTRKYNGITFRIWKGWTDQWFAQEKDAHRDRVYTESAESETEVIEKAKTLALKIKR